MLEAAGGKPAAASVVWAVVRAPCKKHTQEENIPGTSAWVRTYEKRLARKPREIVLSTDPQIANNILVRTNIEGKWLTYYQV